MDEGAVGKWKSQCIDVPIAGQRLLDNLNYVNRELSYLSKYPKPDSSWLLFHGAIQGRSLYHNCGNRFRPGREQTHRG